MNKPTVQHLLNTATAKLPAEKHAELQRELNATRDGDEAALSTVYNKLVTYAGGAISAKQTKLGGAPNTK
jgi:hypothetical protein